MKSILMPFIFILFWGLALPQLHAQTVGSVALTRGKIIIHNVNEDRIYDKPNSKILINEKDEVRSGPKTKLKVYLKNKNEVIHLYSESFLTVNQSDEEQSIVSLLFGKARFTVKRTVSQLNKKVRRFRVRTVNSVIGVLGTEFVVQTTGENTFVLTLDGTVNMANLASPDITVDIPKNQASKTSGKAPPSPPVNVPPDIQQSIVQQEDAGSLEGWDEIEFQDTELSEISSAQDTEEDALETIETVQAEIDNVREAVDQLENIQAASEKQINIIITNP